jgi:hypothetical protein
MGILGLSKKHPYRLMEQASQSALEAKVFSYQAVKQELNLLQTQESQPTIETLPSHENIRGADYYQERTLL